MAGEITQGRVGRGSASILDVARIPAGTGCSNGRQVPPAACSFPTKRPGGRRDIREEGDTKHPRAGPTPLELTAGEVERIEAGDLSAWTAKDTPDYRRRLAAHLNATVTRLERRATQNPEP